MLSNLTATALATITLAQEGDAAAANPIASLLPFLLIGVVFYLLIIRPQKKRQQAQQNMVKSIGVGDDVVTIGGFHGTVIGLDDDTMELQLAPGVVVTMARNAISKSLADPTPLDDVDLDDDFGSDDDTYDDDLDGDDTYGDDTADDTAYGDDDLSAYDADADANRPDGDVDGR